jgi:hypothetical protein
MSGNRERVASYLRVIYCHCTEMMDYATRRFIFILLFKYCFFFYGSTALFGPGPPRFVEVSWSHTFETHHSR